jgi:hypothetical protein
MKLNIGERKMETKHFQEMKCKRFFYGNTRFFQTGCFAYLDQVCEIIIFESILTTLIASIVFRGGWGSSKKWLELEIKPN